MAPIFKGYSCYAYNISKAALNMLTVQYAQDLEAEGFIFISLSPGVSFSSPHNFLHYSLLCRC